MLHSPENLQACCFPELASTLRYLGDDILQYLYLKNWAYSEIKTKISDETLKYF